MRANIAKVISLLCLVASAVLLLPFGQKTIGFIVLAAGAASLVAAERAYAKHLILIYFSLALLGLAEVNTDITPGHLLSMGVILTVAIAVPFVVTRYVYKEKSITYPFQKHTWTKGHVGYLLLAAALSYLLLPLWMSTTGEYQNWTVIADPYHLFILFLGTNGLGIWDELFFIVTVLGLLRQHMPFWGANIIQAVLFTSFLYELGFQGWAPFAIVPFALLQGIVFKKTENLLYIIAIHLTIDFVLYLALIHAHHPELLPIFITYLR